MSTSTPEPQQRTVDERIARLEALADELEIRLERILASLDPRPPKPAQPPAAKPRLRVVADVRRAA